MNKSMFRKGLVFGIIILFVGAGVIPSMGRTVGKKESIESISDGNTLNVGGIGPGNYTKIQDAINDSSNGDTVFVYAYSSPYYENVLVDKSINLIGEDKNITVIDGGGKGDVIHITTNWVNISGFTIINSGLTEYDAGVDIRFSHNTISDNIISNNGNGIFIIRSNDNTITNNIISDNDNGIFLTYLIIWHHTMYSSRNTIIKNNFLDNRINAFFKGGIIEGRNTWTQNYWDRPHLLPKLIFGVVCLSEYVDIIALIMPWFNIDWRPAQEPYDI